MRGTVRFARIVEAVGKPSIHLLWMEPAKDSVLQKAVKAYRVMTVHQHSAETKTDFGVVGHQKGVSGQVLIFPKSLKRFADKRVVGVNYDLLEWPAVPKNQQAIRTRGAKGALKRQPRGTKASSIRGKEPANEEDSPARVIEFPTPKADNEEEPNQDVIGIKNQVRHAMNLLEEGKQVAAFNLLKRIVSS